MHISKTNVHDRNYMIELIRADINCVSKWMSIEACMVRGSRIHPITRGQRTQFSSITPIPGYYTICSMAISAMISRIVGTRLKDSSSTPIAQIRGTMIGTCCKSSNATEARKHQYCHHNSNCFFQWIAPFFFAYRIMPWLPIRRSRSFTLWMTNSPRVHLYPLRGRNNWSIAIAICKVGLQSKRCFKW